MKKKQQTNIVLRWITGKIDVMRKYQKTIDSKMLMWRIQRQKDTAWDGSLCMLKNQAHLLRSLQ